jgi:hypothetical protein
MTPTESAVRLARFSTTMLAALVMDEISLGETIALSVPVS